jgi:hypothetical protein
VETAGEHDGGDGAKRRSRQWRELAVREGDVHRRIYEHATTATTQPTPGKCPALARSIAGL